MDNSLGGFLQSRRARIRPEEVGLPSHGRRRVPGLRREEVAQLAGVSVDYYIRLEQGRGQNVSEGVLEAIGRVLRLDDTEQAHLRDLIRPARAARRAVSRGRQSVRPGLQLLLDGMAGTPAFVLGRRMDVLGWNALADAIAGFSGIPSSERNQARQVFLDPSAPVRYPDWAAVAAETVAYLRLDAGRHPDDPALSALVGELSVKSQDFRRLWADHLVKEKTYGVKRMVHDLAGELEFGYETLALPGDPDQLLVAYTVVPGSATAERLALLASWTAAGTQRAEAP
ncbi:helix-turn-helix transcriptional regulator [Streptomyces sp. NBC_00249]|uniref:helix-turn-helix transcriptional regulator n=1 Tax=Streptomyces sp. NBC_00249 TaxID=2975690 RepID=UPI002256897F|nr:helix-turn-helix transcriptional regulator [Streptomyces sp. NBC_00249]MCX5196077.1 helix-turn-helix transcriptional regulator [Streptomyces sp. NBC_00249]